MGVIYSQNKPATTIIPINIKLLIVAFLKIRDIKSQYAQKPHAPMISFKYHFINNTTGVVPNK